MYKNERVKIIKSTQKERVEYGRQTEQLTKCTLGSNFNYMLTLAVGQVHSKHNDHQCVIAIAIKTLYCRYLSRNVARIRVIQIKFYQHIISVTILYSELINCNDFCISIF